MRRLAAGLALAVTCGTALAGCGEDPDRFGAYCEAVADEQSALTDALSLGGAPGLLAALPSFERLLEAAPRDIEDEWTIVVTRIDVLRDALEDAGVDPASYDPVDPPEGVTDEQQEAIAAGASSVNTEQVREALDGVQQQARDVCGTSLTLG
ncbi:hypothetical protein GCM10023340_35220 [Nocardioides marinquilinus]|uniref:Secreted protein n=1 Tax=Nocardioides marinquilinus TaxID=1210400 RepID=A0ABP9Q1E5_9ACTN